VNCVITGMQCIHSGTLGVHEGFLCAQSLSFTVHWGCMKDFYVLKELSFTVLEFNEDSLIVANLLSIGEKASPTRLPSLVKKICRLLQMH
jgi:hypothetical protein